MTGQAQARLTFGEGRGAEGHAFASQGFFSFFDNVPFRRKLSLQADPNIYDAVIL